MFKETLRYFVLKTNKFWPLRNLYKTIYLLSLKILVYYFKRIPEIETIYLRGSLISEDWIPGDSDIDLTIIIKDISIEKEIQFLIEFWTKFRFSTRILPFLFEEEVGLLTISEFTKESFSQGYIKYAFGIPVENWKLLIGKELRNSKKKDILIFDLPISCYLSYWLDAMFTHFYNKSYRNRDFIRYYYKVSIKLLNAIHAYETGKLPNSTQDLFDYFQEKNDCDNQDFICELKNLRASNYWSSNPSETVILYLYYLTKIIDRFYSQLFNRTCFETKSRLELLFPKQEMVSELYNSEELKTFLGMISGYKGFTRSIISIFSDTKRKRDIYFILKPDFNFDDFRLVLKNIKNQIHVLTVQRITPHISTIDMFSGELYFLSGLSAFNYFYITTKAQIIFGEDIREKLKKPPDEFVHKKSIELAFWLQYISPKWLFRSQTTIDSKPWWLNELLKQRLMLEKEIILSIPLHVEQEYIKNYSHEEETKWLTLNDKKDLYRFTKHVLEKLNY